jgi:hypothetical protein
LVALGASVSSCNFYFSDLQIVNETHSRVSSLTVSAAGKTWKLHDLEPGQSVNFYHHLQGDGGPTIAWTWRGRSFSEGGCYYTDGMPAKGTITIDGEKLLYRCG